MSLVTRMPDATNDAASSHHEIAQLAVDLGSARDLLSVYRRLRAFVYAHTPACGFFVSSYDATTEMRTCVYAYSEDEELDPATFPPMPNTGSPHSRAVVTGETIVTQDFQEAMAGKPRFNVGLDRDPRLPQSSIVVPMKAHDTILGGMEIQSIVPGAFTPEHVAALQMAAHLAALAILNVKSLERERTLRADLEIRAAELETKVRERVRELAAKNRELEAFSFTVAHDLRAPLRAILNLTQEVLRRHGSAMPQAARNDLDAVHASSLQMAQLVEDLLQFARTAQGGVKRELFDMSHLAKAILHEYEVREPERKTDLRVQDNLIVEADPSLVRILLDNIIGNAWKYSARKPIITIRVGARIIGNEVAYYVEDQGVGFDPSQTARLFAAFQRLHDPNEYEGTGIGLATAYRIVQRHGGRIWATTKPGDGATFFFTLSPPRAASPP
ncbi:MAG TPA: ATP-binding protein [Candidatus Thermoplasmatota archaeon]|nr:ATP-binding protein [Candidatus Thermoplasmatota archaeon]